LGESEGRFQVIANSAPVMIRMSGADAVATDFNRPWLEFTGRELDAERGAGWLSNVHPGDLTMLTEARRRKYERRQPYRMEYRLRRADGEYRWVLDSGQPRFTPDGVFSGFIGSAVDITDLRAARATLSNLNRRLMEAQEQERSRVARELHDDVCQQLVLLGLDLDQMSNNIPETATDARAQLNHLHDAILALVGHVNAISHQLHSSKLKFFGLVAAAATLCKEISAHHDVTVEFDHHDMPATISDGVAINLFRVLQEALSNAVKHAGGSRLWVSLRGTGDELQLEVRDAGQRFDPAVVLSTSGIGLVSMEERLKLVDGSVTIQSRPGGGTRVLAVVPLPPQAETRVAELSDPLAK
jgi:PAS domain S-box-containing protein